MGTAMTVLPLQRIQCDRCRTVIVLVATCSDHWGAELRDAGGRPADPRPLLACLFDLRAGRS